MLIRGVVGAEMFEFRPPSPPSPDSLIEPTSQQKLHVSHSFWAPEGVFDGDSRKESCIFRGYGLFKAEMCLMRMPTILNIRFLSRHASEFHPCEVTSVDSRLLSPDKTAAMTGTAWVQGSEYEGAGVWGKKYTKKEKRKEGADTVLSHLTFEALS